MTFERVSEAAVAAFERLPRKGKPASNEWSVLAAFVLGGGEELFRAVALATGNRCLGQASRVTTGDVLNDSHAEVLAHRALQRWLLRQATAALSSQPSALESLKRTDNSGLPQLRLRSGLSLHLYVSQLPCGDAAIIADSEQPAAKRPKFESGAKRLVAEAPNGGDRVCAWEESDGPVVGACRVKPGRGDPTVSMSCSDKIAMWCGTGLQSALLSRIIPEPLRLSSIVVALPLGMEHIDVEAAMERAFKTRIANVFPECNTLSVAAVPQPLPPFRFRDPAVPALRSSGTAINWSEPNDVEVTLSAMGKKLGTTSASWDNPKQRSSLCKMEAFSRFVAFCTTYSQQQQQEAAAASTSTKQTTYRAAKDAAIEYTRRKHLALSGCFPAWTRKSPNEEQFALR